MTGLLRSAVPCILVAVLLILTACGGRSTLTSPIGPAEQLHDTTPTASGWPAGLPADSVQPWEDLGADGMVLRPEKAASSITGDAEFVPGVDYFTRGGSTTDAAGVLAIDSGSAGSGETSFAIYRVVLGGETPGTLGVDLNLRNRSDGSPSEYYIGLADYAANRWAWRGPFREGQVRLGLNDGMLSTLGNAFVALVAYDGADFDVVGLGIDLADGADKTAPPAPVAPTVTPIDGGLMLEWLPVIAGDLAGYNIYFSDASFVDQQSPGVQSIGYIEGGTRHALQGLSGETFLRISAVDISGNESAVSPIASATPLAGSAPPLEVTIDAAVGALGDSFTLTASGANFYDFDLNGDGIFEITFEGSNIQVFSADGTGIIRLAVRGTAGTSVALGAVSLIVSSNSRPLARLYADPAEGPAPLAVSFTSVGEDLDGTIEEYAWDFDGDGIYDETSELATLAPQVYPEGGLFNAKLRVTDDAGASDVDTVSIIARTLVGFESNQLDFDTWYENHLSAAIVDGNPAVVYYDENAFSIEYRRAMDSSGKLWAEPVGITQAANQGDYPELAVIDGRPALFWWDFTNLVMKYEIADDPQGFGWSKDPVVIAPFPSGTNFRIALLEVAGNPAVAWCDGLNLYYRRATSPGGDIGTEWSDPIAVIDGSGFASGPPSLAIINGNPAVVYYNDFTGRLHFLRAQNTTGALIGDWSANGVQVSPAGSSPSIFCNLLEVNGHPAICYADNNTGAMSFVRAADADGLNWPNDTVKVGALFGGTPSHNDMVIYNGVPFIAFYDFYPVESAWFCVAQDADGSSWSEQLPIRLDSAAQAGEFINLISQNGLPYAVYNVPGFDVLEIARPRFE